MNAPAAPAPPQIATQYDEAALGGGLIAITLRSADGRNRLDLELLQAIAEAPKRHPHARGFVLTGNRRYFSVGADLNAIATLTPTAAYEMARAGQASLQALADSPRPFVAAIAGYCIGGGFDLALACHARVCTPDAYLGHHGARLGLVTGWGGTQRLPPLVGAGRTLWQLLTATGWSGERALADGLVNALGPEEELLQRAQALHSNYPAAATE